MRFVGNIDSNGLYALDGTAALAAVSTSAAASTAVSLGTIANLKKFKAFQISFTATNALTGGTCDYVIERQMADGSWDDYFYLGQQSAGATFRADIWLPVFVEPTSDATTGTDASWVKHDTLTDATIALTAGNGRVGMPGNNIRVIARTGTLVSAAAVTNTYIVAYE